jgi:hypothetical protein
MKTLLALSAIGLASVGAFTAGGDAKPAKPKALTYAESVAGILNKNCVSCHRPGEVAPFSLIGYENAKRYAQTIAVATKDRIMPPWKAVPGHGDFINEKRLTDEEIATLEAWAKAGAPRGDIKKEPKTPQFTSGWDLGQPDLVLSPKTEINLAPEGADEYRNFVLDNTSNETRYVTAIDCKPGNRKIVHHLVVFIDGSGAAKKRDDADKDGQEGYTTFGGPGFNPVGILGAWAPGFNVRHTPAGTAFEIKPGQTLVMQVHYHRNGKVEKDRSQLGIYYAKAKPQKITRFGMFVDPTIRITPGEKNYTVKRSFKIPSEMTLYAMMPHMHLLGKEMKVSAETPDGKTIPLVYINDWDFNWQMQYEFKKPIVLPAGSKMTVEAVYDNSAGNPRNPHNPPKLVTFGEETTDEMFVLVFTQTSALDQPFFEIGFGKGN